MRILHVAPIAAHRPTGPGRSVPLQMLAEQRQGHTVALLQTWRGAPPPLPPGAVHVPWAVSRLPIDPRPFPARRLLEEAGFRPDLVHFHSVYLPRHAAVAAAVRRLGIPTVSSPRGGLMPGALARRRWKKRFGDVLFFDRFSRGLAFHRALNAGERDACLARYPRVPVRVAPNAIDLEEVPRLAPPRALPDLQLGFLGRLDVYTKGLDLLLAGFREAVDGGLGAGVHCWIAGPDHRGGVRRVAELVDRLRLRSRVTLMPALRGATKWRFLSRLDLFVHPSRHEALPMGVLEAMAAGRPVLVTHETNLGDVVQADGCGWVTRPAVDEIAAALLRVAGEADTLGARGAAGRDVVRRDFSLETVGALLTRAYEEALGRAPAGAVA